MVFILTLSLLSNSASIDDYVKIGAYSNKIGVTRTMTKIECESKIPKMKRFVMKNKLGDVAMYCYETRTK